jgi:hypothetical protein
MGYKFLHGVKYTRITELDVLFKCFALAMSGDVAKCLESFPNTSIDSFENLQQFFFDR